MTTNELHIGQCCTMKHCFTDSEVRQFAALSQDFNPLHTDSDYARGSRFGQLIVPGMLSSSLFSAIIGTRMPGEGSIYLSQNMSFRRPVFPGHEVEAVVTVTAIDGQRNRVTLDTTLRDNEGNTLITGSALVQLQ